MRVDTKRRLGAKTKAWAEEMARKYGLTVEQAEDIYRNVPSGTNTEQRRINAEKYINEMQRL